MNEPNDQPKLLSKTMIREDMDMSSPMISLFPDRPGLNSLLKESTEGK